MRVLLSYMNKIDDCYFYEGKPFSGVGFEIDNDKNVTAYEIEQGKIIKPYQSVYQMNGKKLRQVDITEEVYDGLFDYQSDVVIFKEHIYYSGIAFEFDNEFCTVERLVINNIVWQEAYWHLNGMLESFEVPNPYLGEEYYEWFSGGEIKKIQISSIRRDRDQGNAIIHFQKDGVISSFDAYSSFFDCFKKIYEFALFFPYADSKDLCKARWAENLHLTGDAFNDNFINMMIESGNWDHVIKLELLHTNIKSPIFSKLKNIRKLCLDGGNKQIHEAIALQLKQERPNISIYIDKFRYDTRH